MVLLANRIDCTGCASCFNICPQSAITMRDDKEGFLQPFIDSDKCVECQLCRKKCPVINPFIMEEKERLVYAVISKKDRSISSSGGAFSFFARWVLDQGGIVYGATMSGGKNVKHVKIDKVEDLHQLRGSKYVQSKIGYTYRDAKKHLLQNEKVLFTGTPCQIAGLYSYLGKKYDGLLLTLDLVCHGVPSPLSFESYLLKLEKEHPKYGKIQDFSFRKLDSWSHLTTAKFENTKWKMLNESDNVYMASFFHGWTFRECCFRCQYANLYRMGNCTIADFWGIGKYGIPYKKNVSSGVSLVIDNSGVLKKNLSILQEYAYIEQRTINEALHENLNLKAPFLREPQRDSALNDLIDPNYSLKMYARKYGLLPVKNLRYYIQKIVKNLVYSLGLYNICKTIMYKIK